MRATVGLPLDHVFPEFIPDVPYAEALEIYRARYLTPRARDAVAAARCARGARAGHRGTATASWSISAKKDTHVRAVLETVGLDGFVDAGGRRAVRGDEVRRAAGDAARWSTSATTSATCAGARGAGAVAVAVATGPTSAADLAAAGADVVLDDLTGWGAWWQQWSAQEARA